MFRFIHAKINKKTYLFARPIILVFWQSFDLGMLATNTCFVTEWNMITTIRMHVTQNKRVLKVTQVTTKNSLRYSLNTSTKFSVFLSSFFSSATKWKDCAIVPCGHWALNTMTTNCDPMRCSHADHACYLDDDWRCHARTGPGHMTNHDIFAYKLFC